jgi:hypothetical protein
MDAVFCACTGVYLANPRKRIRKVWSLCLSPDKEQVSISTTPGLNPDLIGAVVRVVRDNSSLRIVETTNSVYVCRWIRF